MIRVQTKSGAIYQIDSANKMARRIDPDPTKTLPFFRPYRTYSLAACLVIRWADGAPIRTTPVVRVFTVH